MWEEYAWLFPIIFIVHDMEEIIGFGIWLKKNKDMLKEKYPFIVKVIKGFSTEGMALAVYEELLVVVAVTALALLTNYNILWYLWLGGFIGCTLHFVVHIGQSIIVRQYIPCVATSILLLPISMHFIYKCISTIQDNTTFVTIWTIIGVVSVFVNLILIHNAIGWFTRKMKLPSVI